MDPDTPNPIELEAPDILDRGRHRISRRDIDPDCLKVLYRLNANGFTAYLVGGAVRDLMLGRKPADFDVSTNAHPNQIKKLFRNAFLIGRRFRLAHVRFQGGKIIEVSTFRRKPDEEELAAEREEAAARDAETDGVPDESPAETSIDSPLTGEIPESGTGPEPADEAEAGPQPESGDPDAPDLPDAPGGPDAAAAQGPAKRRGRPPIKPIAYGTPREDAFRRDLTINALFYDIATYSVIDYVGGLEDLEAGRIRIIGDPDASYTEDPVRIWRVLRHASRLGFTIEDRTAEAIGRHRQRLDACSGSRLYEELNKDMKSGSVRPFFQAARLHGILPRVLGEVGEFYQADDEAFDKLTFLLGALDASINGGGSPPQEVAYGLLLWPWAEPLLGGIHGDKPKELYEAFRGARATATVPKSILLEAVHALVIVEHMLRALDDGKMRWALKERPRYLEASRIVSLLVEGNFGNCDDPFSLIYRSRFGTRPRSKPHRHRRRKKPILPPPPPAD
ncbi:MAG: poly(A) polymerase [Candidatus Aminicenantes bacterium]|jgi:poly(A) polymerase|nr:poly(A) polymerase [Candidatus Aminicenantes bacterium]